MAWSGKLFRGFEGPSANVVERSIVFTDVVGSTNVLHDVGDAAWFDQISVHHRVAFRLSQSLGCESIVSTGDGVLAVFHTPATAHRFAAELLQQLDTLAERGVHSLQLRIGVAHGPVHQWGANNFGSTMHLAARLCEEAPVGQALLDDATVSGLDHPERTVAAPVNLRGFPATTSAATLMEI